MAKTKYQQAGTDYAKNYLEHLLDIEDMLGHDVNERIDKLLDEKLRQYIQNKKQIHK